MMLNKKNNNNNTTYSKPLYSIRKFTFLLLIFTYLLTSCSNNKKFIGSVNNQKISTDDYFILYMVNLDIFENEHNYKPNEIQRQQIANDTWQRFTDGYIMKDLFDKYNISASSREVIDTLRTNIPLEILQSPRFTNQYNEFDFDKYNSSLISDSPENLLWLRNFYQSTYIPQKKLQKKIISKRTFSEKEIKDYDQIRNSAADIELYTFTPSQIDQNSITISDKEIDDYYQENRINFFVDTQIDFNWVTFQLKPSQKDIKNAEILADSLYHEILLGRDFNNISRYYSAQPYARLNGIVGYMEITDFPVELIDILLFSDIGEVLPPFFYDNAWWIYKIEEKTQNTIRPQIIKIDIKTSKETIDNNQTKMANFLELSNIIGFKRSADELNLEVFEIKNMNLNNNYYISEIGDISMLIREATGIPEKTILTPILVPDEDYYVIFQIEKKSPSYYKTIYAVIDEITDILVEEKINLILISEAEKYKKYSSSIHPKIEHLTIEYLNNRFSPNTTFEILKLNPNESTKIFKNENTVYFAKIINKYYNETSSNLTQNRELLLSELQALDKDEYFENWLNTQRKKAKIKDKRPNILR